MPYERLVALVVCGLLLTSGSGKADAVAVAERWGAVIRAAEERGDLAGAREARERRAQVYLGIGHLDRALLDLDKALQTVDRSQARGAAMRLKGLRGAVQTRAGSVDEARADLGEAFLLAVQLDDRRAEAITLANIGNFLLLEQREAEAALIYQDSAELAAAAEAPDVAAIALLNLADLRKRMGDTRGASGALDRVSAALPTPPGTASEIMAFVKLGRLRSELAEMGPPISATSEGRAAHAALSAARKQAAALGDSRLESYAAGYLGELYEHANRPGEALALTRAALRLAQRANAPESLYLWQWQFGRLKASEGNRAEAIKAYQAAIETLSAVRGAILRDFGAGRDLFETTVSPLVRGLADLLLQESVAAGSEAERQSLLGEARATVELLKAAQIEDYFHDDCLAALQERRREIDTLPPRTAALYPVVLENRIELILSLGGQLDRVRVDASETTIAKDVSQLLAAIIDPANNDYLAPSRQLYQRLIRPIDPMLDAAGVETIVIIPDGMLAAVPFAALHDGRGFLVERRAVAIVPGLALTDPRPLGDVEGQALLGGLTEPVSGFSALPHVAAELEAISTQLPSTVLLNKALSEAGLAVALDRTPYRILHLATHAEFKAEARRSFLLMHNGRIDMNGLERLVRRSQFRDEPIELLTLSACSTAEGDPRAALGLAGVGLKSGARSALASLWAVNDRSTSDLIARFYSGLAQPGATKAAALRAAQLGLLQSPSYRHPAYWAPFLLIGNWL